MLRPQNLLTIDHTWRHHFDLALIGKNLSIGIPNGLENGIFQIGKIVLLSLVSTFGTVSITANAVTGAIVSIQCIPGNVLGMAMMTVVAQSVGAGDYPQAKYYTRKLMTLA